MPFAPRAPEYKRPADGPSDGIFYTNRCGNAKNPGCNRALTKLEILGAIGANPTRKSVCPCGSNGFRSSNFKWWEELLLPRSWKLWRAIRRGELAPPPDKRYRDGLDAAILEAANKAAMEGEGDDE